MILYSVKSFYHEFSEGGLKFQDCKCVVFNDMFSLEIDRNFVSISIGSGG